MIVFKVIAWLIVDFLLFLIALFVFAAVVPQVVKALDAWENRKCSKDCEMYAEEIDLQDGITTRICKVDGHQTGEGMDCIKK